MSRTGFNAILDRALSRINDRGPHTLTLGAGNIAPGRHPVVCDPHQAQFWQIYLTPDAMSRSTVVVMRLRALMPAVLLFAALADRAPATLSISSMNYGPIKANALPELVHQISIFADEGDDLVPVSGRHMTPLRDLLRQACSSHGRLTLLGEIAGEDWHECDLSRLPVADPT
ncbi:MAG: hypothetical protein Q4P24_10545 [Rhodobacterales bacterium]|nr:hypothetical protein [Rhodobacterales bacterium]